MCKELRCDKNLCIGGKKTHHQTIVRFLEHPFQPTIISSPYSLTVKNLRSNYCMAILFKTLHRMLLHVGRPRNKHKRVNLMTFYVSYTLYLASSRRSWRSRWHIII